VIKVGPPQIERKGGCPRRQDAAHALGPSRKLQIEASACRPPGIGKAGWTGTSRRLDLSATARADCAGRCVSEDLAKRRAI